MKMTPIFIVSLASFAIPMTVLSQKPSKGLVPAISAGPVQSAQERFKALPNEKKAELRKRYHQFESLSEAQKQKLKDGAAKLAQLHRRFGDPADLSPEELRKFQTRVNRAMEVIPPEKREQFEGLNPEEKAKQFRTAASRYVEERKREAVDKLKDSDRVSPELREALRKGTKTEDLPPKLQKELREAVRDQIRERHGKPPKEKKGK